MFFTVRSLSNHFFINLMRVFGFDISLPTEQFALLLYHENQYEYH